MSTLLYNRLTNTPFQYCEKKVRKNMLLSRVVKDDHRVKKYKEVIYDSLSKVIVKNVNNFFNLIKDVPKEYVIHTKDDIVVECFIILNKCIDKFNINKKDAKFFFYYNKALSHGLYRFKNRQYRVSVVNYDNISQYEESTFSREDKNPLLLKENFTELELLLIDSKCENICVDDFIEGAKINRITYFKTLKSVKEKLIKHYK